MWHATRRVRHAGPYAENDQRLQHMFVRAEGKRTSAATAWAQRVRVESETAQCTPPRSQPSQDLVKHPTWRQTLSHTEQATATWEELAPEARHLLEAGQAATLVTAM